MVSIRHNVYQDENGYDIDTPEELDIYMTNWMKPKVEEYNNHVTIGSANASGAGNETAKKPLYIFVAFGKNDRVSLGVLTSHTYCDGLGFSTLGAMIILYVLTPKLLWWCTIDRLISKNEAPSMIEMTLKGDYDSVMKSCNYDPFLLPNNTYKNDSSLYILPTSEEEEEEGVGEQDVKHDHHRPWKGSLTINKQQLKKIKTNFRNDYKITLTPGFLALAGKVFVTLLESYGMFNDDDDHDDDRNNNKAINKKLIVNTAFDVRNMGQWNTKKRNVVQKIQIPIIGDYVGDLYTILPIHDVLHKSFPIMAQIICNDIHKVKTNSKFRLGCVIRDDPAIVNYVIGTTSFQMRTEDFYKVGFTNPNVSAEYDVSKMGLGYNYVWIYLVSYVDTIMIQIDVSLPFPNLTKDKIHAAIKKSVQSTCLESIFSNIDMIQVSNDGK